MLISILTLVLSALGPIIPGVAATIGETVIKSRQTEAARQGRQDEAAVSLGNSWLQSVTEANRTRADARKNEGPWGPLGIITILLGAPIVWHSGMVFLDSSPLLPGIVWLWDVIPFPWIVEHQVGSWRVPAPPGEYAKVEISVIQALFYVSPPSAALIVAARAFRR